MVSPGSWVLRFREERKQAWDPSIRPCIHPHSRPNRRPGAGESRKGRGGVGGRDGGKRERPHEYAGKVRVPSVRVA